MELCDGRGRKGGGCGPQLSNTPGDLLRPEPHTRVAPFGIGGGLASCGGAGASPARLG